MKKMILSGLLAGVLAAPIFANANFKCTTASVEISDEVSAIMQDSRFSTTLKSIKAIKKKENNSFKITTISKFDSQNSHYVYFHLENKNLTTLKISDGGEIVSIYSVDHQGNIQIDSLYYSPPVSNPGGAGSVGNF